MDVGIFPRVEHLQRTPDFCTSFQRMTDKEQNKNKTKTKNNNTQDQESMMNQLLIKYIIKK